MATFNLRKFTNPDLLKTIAPGRLVGFLNSWREYLTERGLNFPTDGSGEHRLQCPGTHPYGPGCQRAEGHDRRALLRPRERVRGEHGCAPRTGKVTELQIEHDPGTTPADVAIQMWLAAPDMLREHHAEAIAFRQKNFLYYGGAHGEKRAFPAVDNELRLRIEAALDDWFEEHKRGRGCHIFLFPHGKKVWILYSAWPADA